MRAAMLGLNPRSDLTTGKEKENVYTWRGAPAAHLAEPSAPKSLEAVDGRNQSAPCVGVLVCRLSSGL